MNYLMNWKEIVMFKHANEKSKRPKLTVVVIAYNNELYIEEALESLHEQTLQDMEVVVVNDLSSDKTGELIERFIQGKPKFKVIHHKENSGGCSAPRNTGIANSTGDYIMFLDGDDWYTVDACEKMVASIERTNSDFVSGQVIRTNNYHIWYHHTIYSKNRTNLNIREFPIMLYDTLSVNKIYKRSFLDKHQLRFPEGIHYEDIVFTGKAYFLAESISIITEPIYYWRVVEDADVKSITNRRFEFANFKNRIIAHRLYDEFLREHGEQLYQHHKNNKFLRHDLKLYTNDYLLYDEEYKTKFHQLTYEYLHEIMDEYAFISLPERERIAYYLMYIGDIEAFNDYIAYINGLPTVENRIYSVGGNYYFKASNEHPNDKKFLHIKQLEILPLVRDIELKDNVFSFNGDVQVASIASSEVICSWTLENLKERRIIQSEPSNGKNVRFLVNDFTPGNYYLHLYVNHLGNTHKQIIKKVNIDELPNMLIKDQNASKIIYINQYNSFAIQVSYLKAAAKFLFALKRNVKPSLEKKVNAIGKIYEKYAKKVYTKLPVRSNWVLFESHMGKQYSDSPKYIYEELSRENRKYKYIWSFVEPDSVEVPGPSIKVKRNSLKHFYYLVRSKYWVDNQGMAKLAPKRKEQVYLQTWHGTPLKRMGYDQNNLPSEQALSTLRFQVNAWNYFVSPNSYSTTIFKGAFRYDGEVIESGYPRNDVLINKPDEMIQKTKEHFKIDSSKKVVLFAPTFRDWDPNSFQKALKDIQSLSEKIDDNTVVLLRLHYLLANKIKGYNLKQNIINASSYQDIQELYLISDILITDYSSVMFDFALLKRPIILYCYDLDEYLYRRGTYFNLEEKSPGPICSAIEEVIGYLNKPNGFVDYEQALDRFSEEFGSKEDGQATQRVIKEVFE